MAMSPLAFTYMFLKAQFFAKISTPTGDFSNQTIIVTGSNTGLGLEAARHLVRLGAAKVILAVRTMSKGEAAAADIVESCNVSRSIVEVWELDMADPESIKAFAARASELERLDAAILNAGLMTFKWSETKGIENHIAVNVIGTILLSVLLLPKLRASAKQTGQRGRLTIVGSDLTYMVDRSEITTSGSIMDKLNSQEQTGAAIANRYGLSKLLVVYNVQYLASRVPSSEVLISTLTPGACRSEIFRDDMHWFMKNLMQIGFNTVARSTEMGGGILVDGVRPDLSSEAHGRFLMDCKVVASGANVDDPVGRELAAKWNEEMIRKLNQIAPGCMQL